MCVEFSRTQAARSQAVPPVGSVLRKTPQQHALMRECPVRLQFKPPFRGTVLCSSNPRRTFILFNKIISPLRQQFNSFRSSVFDTFRPCLPLLTQLSPHIDTFFARGKEKFLNGRTLIIVPERADNCKTVQTALFFRHRHYRLCKVKAPMPSEHRGACQDVPETFLMDRDYPNKLPFVPKRLCLPVYVIL